MRLSRCAPIPLLLVLLFLNIGCSRSSNQPQAASPGQDTDSRAPRLAVFSPAMGVMLRDLGLEDMIVARHNYDSALSRSIPAVGTHLEIDYEVLINAQPTMLLFEENESGIPPRLVRLAERSGWTIWTHKLSSLDDVATTLDDLYLMLVGFPEKQPGDEDLLSPDLDPTARFNIELPSARLARSWSAMGAPAEGAGRTLLLAGVDPPGALGPGSFHAQMIERMGITPALSEGGMWQELDLEDIVRLAPDSILIFDPQPRADSGQIGEPEAMSWDETMRHLGPIASVPIPAIEHRRVGVITHPQALLPSSTLAAVADEVREILMRWYERDQSP